MSFLKSSVIAAVTFALSSCSLQFDKQINNSLSQKTIKEKKLADGTPVKVGLMKPLPSWGCKELGSKFYNWDAIKLKSLYMDSYGYLDKQSIAYASQMPVKPNYIFTHLSDEVALNSIVITGSQNAEVYFYQCKNTDLK